MRRGTTNMSVSLRHGQLLLARQRKRQAEEATVGPSDPQTESPRLGFDDGERKRRWCDVAKDVGRCGSGQVEEGAAGDAADFRVE